MICKYCIHFKESPKSRIEWLSDKKKIKIKLCEFTNNWVELDHPICEDFAMTDVFWCNKEEHFIMTDACMNRQIMKSSCIYGCREKQYITDLLNNTVKYNLEKIEAKIQKKKRKIKKRIQKFQNNEVITNEKENKTKSDGKDEKTISKPKIEKKRKKRVYRKKREDNSGTDNEKIENVVETKKRKRGRPRKVDKIEVKKVLKQDLISEILKKEKNLRQVEKTDIYNKFISGIERGHYLFVGKRGGLKYGKTWEEAEVFKIDQIEGK